MPRDIAQRNGMVTTQKRGPISQPRVRYGKMGDASGINMSMIKYFCNGDQKISANIKLSNFRR